MARILIIIENYEGRLRSETFHAISAAHKYAKHISGEISALILGPDAEKLAKELSRYPVKELYVLDQEELTHYTAEYYVEAIAQFLKDYPFDVIVGAVTTFIKDTFPRLTARISGSMVNDVTEFLSDAKFKRPMYAGSAIATVSLEGSPKVISIRSTSFDAVGKTKSSAPITKLNPVSLSLPYHVKFDQFEEVKSERPKLTEAKRVVSGGRGLKSGDNFSSMIESLADVVGAAIGASRAAVDSGFCPNDYQVGQTGKVVAPELYIAVGISGAIQHLAGMKDSKVIVAINKDEEAPIFEIADFGLVADLFKAIPELVEELKKDSSSRSN